MIIHPFKALYAAPERAQSIASAPYDIVSTAEAKQLSAGNALSFLRVVRSEIDLPEGIARQEQRLKPACCLDLHRAGAVKNQLTARVWFDYAGQRVTPTQPGRFVPVTPVAAEDMQYDIIDGGFNFFWCFDDNTGPGSPDGGTCVLPGEGEVLSGSTLSTGTWWLIPSEWANADATYFLTILMDGEQ